jgi:hypothetical protein
MTLAVKHGVDDEVLEFLGKQVLPSKSNQEVACRKNNR